MTEELDRKEMVTFRIRGQVHFPLKKLNTFPQIWGCHRG